MGITGLLPFLEKSSRKTNINEFSGGTVAVDTYCWLHKGVFSCADKISMGKQTNAYVQYCMRFVNMLLSYKIKPILVFDGRHLPAKAETETKRQESREANRRRAAELIRMGQIAEGRSLLKRAIDVTHAMALEVIKECHKVNVDCIVAPYEADAQLAYLNVSGIADVVITEDSDLTLFGCKKVFFKMDQNGNGLLIQQDKLHLAMGTQPHYFDYEKFRYMCILSGCDYLASLPGIGLGKAKKFITKNTEEDIHKALTRLGSYLNMKTLVVSKEYRDAFIQALMTFKHQLVYCPLQRKQIRLSPPTPDVTQDQLNYAGKEVDPDLAYQLALGNCDPFTFQMLHDYDPDKCQDNEINSQLKGTKIKKSSIWSQNYNIEKNSVAVPMKDITCPNTVAKKPTMAKDYVKRETVFRRPDNAERADKLEFAELSLNNMLKTYTCTSTKAVDKSAEENEVDKKTDTSETEPTSPVLLRRTKSFTKEAKDNSTSPNLLMVGKTRSRIKNLIRFKKTCFDENIVTRSKFFMHSEEKGADILNSSTEIEKQVPFEQTMDTISKENVHDVLHNLEQNKDKQDEEEKLSNNDSCHLGVELISTSVSLVNICNKSNNQHKMHMDMARNPSEDPIDNSLQLALGVHMYECDLKSSVNEVQDTPVSHCAKKLRYESPETEKDFLVKDEDCNEAQSTFFMSNSRTGKTNIAETNYKKKITQVKTTSRRKPFQSQSSIGGNSQPLLSMYGFQRKAALKH